MRYRRLRDRGMVLIITFWVLTILTVLALTFAAAMHIESRAAHNQMQRTQAYYAAKAGVERAVIAYQSDQTGYFSELSEWVYLDSDDEEFPFGDEERYEVLVTDEGSKIDINIVDEETLNELPQMTPELIDCILDWRDEDEERRRDGAESEHYMRLNPPRLCANRTLMTLQELLLVEGVTDEIFYGPRASRPMAVRLPSEELEAGEDDAAPLEEILTVYGGMNDQDSQGRDRVNINVAEEDEIAELTGEILNESDLTAIINRRNSRPYESIGDLLELPGITREKMQQIAELLTTRSAPTEDESQPGEPEPEEEDAPEPQIPGMPGTPGQPGGGMAIPGMDMPRQIPPLTGGVPAMPETPPTGPEDEGGPGGPGQQQPGQADSEDLPTPDEYRHGVYNINTAPAEVLMTLEGMNEELAEQIVDEREQEPFASRGDLLRMDVMSNEVFTQVVESVSVRTATLKITSVGSLDEGRARVKLTAIVDMKSGEPQVVHLVEG